MRVSCMKLIRTLTQGGCRLLRNSHVRLPAGKAEGAIESISHFETKFEMTREFPIGGKASAKHSVVLDLSEPWDFDSIGSRLYAEKVRAAAKRKSSSP